MPELRCVFVTVSPLLSDIIAGAVSQRLELRSLAEFGERKGFAGHLSALVPDLVVIGLNAGETDEIGASVLALVPRAKVLLISGDGKYAYIYEMRPHRTVLSDFSPTSLLAAAVGDFLHKD